MDKLESEEEITAALKENYFLYDTSDYDFVEEAGSAFRDYRRNLFQGAALHIFCPDETVQSAVCLLSGFYGSG